MITKICKECLLEKELSLFYKHPQGVLGTLPRCKECIKAGRKTERERKMARINDTKRNKKTKRILYKRIKSKRRKNNNPEKNKAHLLVYSYFKKSKIIRPNKCSNCFKLGNIELHHEDYNKPNEVIPLCVLCHKQYHSGIIDIIKDIIILPF